jgi:hypothetical protein
MHWRKCLYHFVEVLEQWQYNGEWWLTPDLGGAQRRYCRIAAICDTAICDTAICAQSKVSGEETLLEIYEEGGQWILSRLLD